MTDLKANRQELALLRGKRSPEHMALWVKEFAEGDKDLAERYAIAVATFLGGSGAAGGAEWASYVGKLSPRTREAYAFAVTEFFEWAARKYGHVVPPHRVLRKDAEDYANWLSNRPFSLTEEKLTDTDQELRLAVYRTVERVGPADRKSVYAALPAVLKPSYTLEDLTFSLGRMVLHDLLERSPTLAQIRVENPRAGIDQHTILVPGPNTLVQMDLADVFQYSVPPPRGVSRSTIALRLSALSTFWDVLAQGENIPGGQAILQHNIFKGMKKRVTRGLSRERKAASAARRMDPVLVARMLAAVHNSKTLPQKRDKALLYFLVFTGSRLSEAVNLRRGEPPASETNRWPGWFVNNTEPPVVRVRRKGGKLQSLPYPPIALRALADFQADLDRRAAPTGAQSEDPRMANYIHPNSARWRYRELARMPDAPLFPPVHFWGANSTFNYQEFKPNAPNTYGPPPYRRSMSKAGVYKLLVRIARRAGMTEDEIRQVHPHALRHFAATAMAKGGKDLREIQAILGHESVTTTEGYLADVESPVALSGQSEILEYLSQFEEAAEAVPPPPPAVPKAPRREVVDTYGIPAPEAPARPPKEPEPAKPPVTRKAPEKPTEEAVAREIAATTGPTPAQEIAAIQDAIAYVPAEEPFGHTVATAPSNPEPPVYVAATAEGHVTIEGDEVVAIEGEPLEKDIKAEVVIDQSIRDRKSPGSPEEAYEALERGDHWERIEFTMVDQRTPKDNALVTINLDKKGRERVQRRFKGHEFLAAFYDPWPQNYGLGTVSLLPWFTKGSAAKDDGRITGKDPITGKAVEVPPLPVLAPEQVLPETMASPILDGLEDIYTLWVNGDPARGIPPSPSRTFGLVRWYGFFAHTTGALQAYLRDKKKEYDRDSVLKMGLAPPNVPTWVPWNALATVGKHVRAHKDEWVLSWFRENAHTFTTSRRLFERAISRRKQEDRPGEEGFIRAFASVSAEAVWVPATLPDWFADNDPVHAIYEADPEEWERFASWMANITGQKLGKQRREARKDAADFSEKSWEEKRDEAEALLMEYYEYAEALKAVALALRKQGVPDKYFEYAGEDKATLLRERAVIEAARAERKDALKAVGILDPDSVVTEGDDNEEPEEGAPPVPRDRQKRIQVLLDAYLPRPEEEADPNVLRRSTLFDPRLLNIDYAKHTISHTEEFREVFAEQFDGRDSELVMRRAARAMWEHAKEKGQVEKMPGGKKAYEALYSVMLAYVSWIVPPPEEMEAQAIAAGRVSVPGPGARKSWLMTQADMLYTMAYGTLVERIPQERLDKRRKLLEEGKSREEADRILADEYAERLMEDQSEKGSPVTEEEARAALRRLEVLEAFGAEMRLGEEAQAKELLIASTGPEGYVTTRAFREEAEKERQKERKARRWAATVAEPAPALREGERVIAAGVIKRPGAMKANAGARVMFEFLESETRIDAWYILEYNVHPPEHSKKYAPNRGAVRYVSPAAMARKQRMLANARQVLPSPFRMIAAMNLSAIEP